MPALNKDCSVYQGFNFKNDKQETVGHLLSLKIGEQDLTADISVTDPLEAGGTKQVKVVGVASGVYWEGGYADPVQISVQISVTNKNEAATLLHKTMENTTVLYEFAVYEFDRETKAYFKALHSGEVQLKGILSQEGGELQMFLDDTPNSEVQKPENYGLQIAVVPEDEEQSIHLAVSSTKKFAKQWGIPRT